MKKTFRQYPIGTTEYVIAHAKWRVSRGKKQPSVALTKISPLARARRSKNPKVALHNARVILGPTWRLQDVDQFDGTVYRIRGTFLSLEEAYSAARRLCQKIERTQPTRSSGDQQGIQNIILIVCPNGSRVHVHI